MEFHNPDSDTDRFRFRLGVAAIFVLAAFAILFSRFVWLQVIQYDFYHTRAEDNRITLVPIVPSRGFITDRNGVVLANNYTAFTLEITPSQTGDLEATIAALSKVIDISSGELKRFHRLLGEAKNFESVPIKRGLTDTEVARFAAQRFRFPGVDIKARLFRHYPLGEVASHAIGYIGRINDRDLDWIENEDRGAQYNGTDHIGKSGLEQHYEFALHGQPGYEQVEIDASGRPLRILKRTAPISGNNLQLTLDIKLQEMVEKAFGDRKGALVAIDPETGGILALVSKPEFDPNLFVDGISTEDWKNLNDNPDHPMINRAIGSAYPPGSTFKPFMALGALETGKRGAGQVINDPGFFKLGNHTFRDDKPGGHGKVDMHKAIVESCDTYFYSLANDMGIDAIARFMASIGLGQRTGVDLGRDSRTESAGVLPSPEWKQERFRRPEQQRWYAGETVSIGIGQGYNAYTPIQLAQAVATLANNGVMYRPHLVQNMVDTRSGVRRPIEPEPIRRLNWKQKNIDVIKRAMVGVNTEGTGARAFAGAPYTSGGKTGTAQLFSLRGSHYKESSVKQRLRDHALFIAFAPADKPKIALAVLVENGGFGAQSAAPIARMVLDYYLLGKTPDGAAPEDSAAAEEDAAADEATTAEPQNGAQ